MSVNHDRTIVLSDIHGEPGIIRAVVEHSGFDAATDRLIFAGDAVEIGRDTMGCLDLLEELGAECLVGNHEYELFLGTPLEAEPVSHAVFSRVAEYLVTRQWHLVAEADGVLITHAGLDATFADRFAEAGDAFGFAEELNSEFAGEIALVDIAEAEVTDSGGPLWWRPSRSREALPGVKQIIGHTPPESLIAPNSREYWAARGVYMVDPCVRCWRNRSFAPPVPIRYAVIEAGEVRVVEA